MDVIESFLSECTEPVRDPLWKNILFPASFEKLLFHPSFVKLSRIMQLGPTHLVYPGATHSRRAHSIGVYAMALRIVQSLPGIKPLVTAEGLRSFLVAALCHDTGHFPYTHSLKELPLVPHEALTGRILAGEMEAAVKAAGAAPEKAAAIVDESMRVDDPELLLYRKILSGTLDPDKLDYLNRDAWACGVPYGIQDVDFVLQHILVEDGNLAVDTRGIMSVEGLLFSKYQMYKAVYWHKMVRSATAMIKQGVIKALHDGALAPESLYGLDDHGFFSLFAGLSHDSARLVGSVRDGLLYSPVYEKILDADCERFRDMRVRNEKRELLVQELSGRDAIIDITEPISLESDLRVAGTGSSVTELSTVFNRDLVHAFERDLWRMRVYVSGEADANTVQTVDRVLSGK